NMQSSPILNGTSVMYDVNKFMMSGGGPSESAQAEKNTAVVDISGGNPAWRSTSQMAYPRYLHNLVVLPDGKVLAIGGATVIDKNAQGGTLPAEIWDPATETWT